MSKKKDIIMRKLNHYNHDKSAGVVGLAQLEQFKKIIKEKINISINYKKYLKNNDNINFLVMKIDLLIHIGL